MREKAHHRPRELRRDEVFVAPGHLLPEEWERNNSLFRYRLIKRTGWVGKLVVVLFLLLILGGGISSLFDHFVVGAIAAAVIAFAVVVTWTFRGRH
jgi:hypothetical protein